MKNYFRIENPKEFKRNILLFIVVALLILFPAIGDTMQCRYTQYGTVLEVDEDETLIVDAIGDVWCIYDTDYHVGDEVKIYFDTNCTDYTHEDDIILKVKKINKKAIDN